MYDWYHINVINPHTQTIIEKRESHDLEELWKENPQLAEEITLGIIAEAAWWKKRLKELDELGGYYDEYEHKSMAELGSVELGAPSWMWY